MQMTVSWLQMNLSPVYVSLLQTLHAVNRKDTQQAAGKSAS